MNLEDDDSMSAELKMFNKLEKEAEKLEKTTALPKCHSEEDLDHTGVYTDLLILPVHCI